MAQLCGRARRYGFGVLTWVFEFGSTGVDVAFAGYNGTSFVLEEAGGASRQTVAGISASNGQSYLIVLRIDAALGNDSITMYVNPTPGLAPHRLPIR